MLIWQQQLSKGSSYLHHFLCERWTPSASCSPWCWRPDGDYQVCHTDIDVHIPIFRNGTNTVQYQVYPVDNFLWGDASQIMESNENEPFQSQLVDKDAIQGHWYHTLSGCSGTTSKSIHIWCIMSLNKGCFGLCRSFGLALYRTSLIACRCLKFFWCMHFHSEMIVFAEIDNTTPTIITLMSKLSSSLRHTPPSLIPFSFLKLSSWETTDIIPPFHFSCTPPDLSQSSH